MKKSLLYSVVLLLMADVSQSQSGGREQYPLVYDSVNVICNAAVLQKVFEKLHDRELGARNRISIVHLGDSHIQADFFSGKLRHLLQQKFGNAGRGLVFPHKLSGTNEAVDFRFISDYKWQSNHIRAKQDSLPSGISGFAFYGDKDSVQLAFEITHKMPVDYCFDAVTLIYRRDSLAFDLVITDTSGRNQAFIKSFPCGDFPYSATFSTDTLMDAFHIRLVTTDTLPRNFLFWGMSLERQEPGILYHAIGINGAEFRHFANNKLLHEQIPLLSPDLIIVSLGTNDAYVSKMDSSAIVAHVNRLLDKLRQYNPDVAILFTLAPDSYRKRKHKNPQLLVLNNILRETAERRGAAYWDMMEVMGGYGAMQQWHHEKLATNDKIHFTRSGYELQGTLLYEALIHGLEHYKY